MAARGRPRKNPLPIPNPEPNAVVLRSSRPLEIDSVGDSAVAPKETEELSETVVELMESVGLGPIRILQHIKELLDTDISQLVDIDSEGNMKLKRKLDPKHMRGVAEFTEKRLKPVNKVDLIKLSLEVARMMPKEKSTLGPVRNFVVALPAQKTTEEAFSGIINITPVKQD